MERETEEEGDGCICRDSLISFVTKEMADRKERQRVQDHLQQCGLCQEEVTEIEDLINRDPAEEVADCYRQVDLAEIEVPEDFLDKFFHKNVLRRVMS
jgi:hypothetical protein